MFVKRFFEPGLAQASYLIGCSACREAIVIDPNRDAAQYVEVASAEGLRIKHVTETHIHADYLSGSRELAKATGAKLYLSGEGGADWQYAFVSTDGATVLREGDRIAVGNVRIDVLHTPGHTPEHLTFLVTDGAVATEPIAAVTGDFIFVGDVGRPDLLERAANIKGTMEAGARVLFQSLRRFADRPDWLQIWPGHGAGSACGKGISAIPQSTLGYERRFNWAFQIREEGEFVASVLAGQPDPPKYFAKMKQLNREGPAILGGFRSPARLDRAALDRALSARAVVVDLRRAAEYAVAHVPGTISIPLDASFTNWAGWLVPYGADFYVIAPDPGAAAVDRAVRDLAMIGLDRVAGWFDASVIDEWAAAGGGLGSVPQITPSDLSASLSHDAVTLLDVRNDNEWVGGHIAGARHIPLGHLTDALDSIPRTRPIVVQCAAGSRSSIGASLLRARGVERVANLTGGIAEWRRAGLPTVTDG
jgi:hydroxyacylglutathione hydrolase